MIIRKHKLFSIFQKNNECKVWICYIRAITPHFFIGKDTQIAHISPRTKNTPTIVKIKRLNVCDIYNGDIYFFFAQFYM